MKTETSLNLSDFICEEGSEIMKRFTVIPMRFFWSPKFSISVHCSSQKANGDFISGTDVPTLLNFKQKHLKVSVWAVASTLL